MSSPVNSLDFLFPYIAFNSSRQNYQDAINAWKSVLDQVVANGLADKNELLGLCEDWSVKISDLSHLIDQLHNDENNAMNQFNTFFNPSSN